MYMYTHVHIHTCTYKLTHALLVIDVFIQAENLLSRIQQLKDLIDQSESIILINLDSQRNVMMKLSLQLEMGMFSCTICGLMGLAFGMNLDSSLENVRKLLS